MRYALLGAAALLLASPGQAQRPPAKPPAQPTTRVAPLADRLAAILAQAPKGMRFGLLAVDDTGHTILAINPDERFIPASNTKLFTTAAAFAEFSTIDAPDTTSGAQVALVPADGLPQGPGKSPGPIDVVVSGHGDARLSSSDQCLQDCLGMLADAIAAKAKRVRDVVGDDGVWPDQRWAPGMSWNNIGTVDGTAVSALTLDDNRVVLTVTPGAPGMAPRVTASDYFTLINQAVTAPAGSGNTMRIERAVNSRELRLYGQIAADAAEWRGEVGIDDPAHYAAWRLAALLKARGVKITGTVKASHRPQQRWDEPDPAGFAAHAALGPPALAALTPPPLAEDLVRINKDSQNLHAELLFRRLGAIAGTGSQAWSSATLTDFLVKVGVPREGFEFADGAGMSSYNRASPRATVALLRWAVAQPWGAAYRATLPIAGVDGTLRRRFSATALQGKLFAKTGTLNASSAISGYLTAASGRTITFSLFANDIPAGHAIQAQMETLLLEIAAAN